MNNEKIKFRKVERKDLGEVFLLLQQLTEIDYSNRNEEDCWNKFNSNTSSNSIVGLYKDKVIAYGSLVVENKIRGEAAGHIEDIVVDNKVRGNNVGVILIDELIKIGKEKECYRITLFCKEHLIKFYNKNGFEVNSMAMKLFPK
jgi:ribosomal protein S18 acetylase RimI-like enzyme